MSQPSNVATSKKETLRWGNGMRADCDFARDQILTAALACYQKYTLQGTRMEQIANEAKVTRTTIYRHFQNRNDVVLGVIFRELYSVLDTIRDQISKKSTFAEFIVETISAADEKIRQSPIFDIIVKESAMLMERIHTYGTEMVAIGAVYFRARFDVAKAAGELQPDIEYEEFISWVCHVSASFILLSPNTQNSKELRPMLWRYLIPGIIRPEAIPANKLL